MTTTTTTGPATAAGPARTPWAPTVDYIGRQAATVRARLAELEARARDLETALHELGDDGEGSRRRIAFELRELERAVRSSWCELTLVNPAHHDRHAAVRATLAHARAEPAVDTPWRPEHGR